MGLNEPLDSLTEVVSRLDEVGVPYMVTGSVAAWFCGLNRYTEDTDIVIYLKWSQITDFVAAFRGDYYVDRLMVEDSVRTLSLFNVISQRGGGKFDMIPLRPEPAEQAKFERRVVHDWHGYPLWVIDPHDLVLSKLQWAKETRSEKQFADIRAIMSSGLVDENNRYFQKWLRALDLGEVLEACREARHDA